MSPALLVAARRAIFTKKIHACDFPDTHSTEPKLENLSGMRSPSGRYWLSRFIFLLLCATAVAGCGRERVDDSAQTIPTLSEEDAIGAFDEELLGRIRAQGDRSVLGFVSVAGRKFRAEEPGVRVSATVSDTAKALSDICGRGRIDIAASAEPISEAGTKACASRGQKLAELHVANSTSSEPVFLYVRQSSLRRLEVESFLEYVIGNDDELARASKLEPLSEDELQATQTAFEQAIGLG